MNADASQLEPALLEAEVSHFSTDSREMAAGADSVFFALSPPEYENNGFTGDFQDAHRFVPAAFANGATVAVVRPDRFAEHRADLERYRDRLIFVGDAIAALQKLARGVYLEWNQPVVAITGSAGKTTAKEMTAHVLESSGRRVLRNKKNFNNGIGHPLTVLGLVRDRDFDVAVLEMGMSTPLKEIARLCRITPPDFAVELNVLPVHVEHLGSIENVARAKAELIEGMKPGGTAILNADDPRVLAMARLSRGKTLTYGIEQKADITAAGISSPRFGETEFVLRTPDGEAKVLMQLIGRHNVLNGLAASAVGHCFGMTATDIAAALATITPPTQRGEVLHFAEGFTVINDSYNSNPAALLSMIETLREEGQQAGRRIVLAGEMLELGEDESEIHRATGRSIAGAGGIDLLVGVRGLARELIAGARENGLRETEFFADSETAGEYLADRVRAGDLVLIKGSRGVRTEKAVEKLLEKFDLSSKQ